MAHPREKKIYVANRICKITKLISTKAVPSKENPADCASRGITARELINHPLWWHGPPWLQKQPLCTPSVSAAEIKRQKDENPECDAKPLHTCSVAVKHSDSRLEEASNSFSTLVKITCWVMRFIARAKKKKVPSERRLTVAESLAAEDLLILIKRSQARTYSLEIQLLSQILLSLSQKDVI